MKPTEHDELLPTLKARFDKHAQQHKGIAWSKVEARLQEDARALNALAAMEASGGEPDVIGYDKATGEYVFCDCAAESPAGRRSFALVSRTLGLLALALDELPLAIELLTEAQYRELQLLGEFDTKTSSWIATPDDVRALGGALFCDRRYGRVFVYHNGAESYYAARAFRGLLRV